MPELPEVETVMRGLAPVMEGQRIHKAEARRPDLRWPLPAGFAARLTGTRVTGLRRRSKYILADLSSDETLIIHLGMSGRMVIQAPVKRSDKSQASDTRVVKTQAKNMPGGFHHVHNAPAKHDHIILNLETGQRVVFNDPRRFGMMDLIATPIAETHKLLATLGPEPLSNAFSPTTLVTAFKDRRAPVKGLLLDQRIVAGLGNIYVCEALWRAGISPTCAGGRIGAARIDALTHAIRDVLMDAIAAGGSSLRDYRQVDGDLGYFQHRFAVYAREGEPCARDGCIGQIRRVVQSSRSSFYCPACQS